MEELKTKYLAYKHIILPIMVGVSSLIIVLLVLIPQISSYLQINGTIADNTQKLGVLQAKAQDLSSIDEQAYQKNLQTVYQLLPTDKSIPEILIVLQTLLNRSGLSLENIKLTISNDETSTKTKKKQELPVSISVRGAKSSLQRFLTDLQNSPRLMRVDSISATSSKGTTAVEIIDADIMIEAYYEPPVTSIGAVDQPLPKLTQEEQKLLQSLGSRLIINTNTPVGSTSAVPIGSSSAFPRTGRTNPFE
jgi:Tfp pilus assembly protein PilO